MRNLPLLAPALALFVACAPRYNPAAAQPDADLSCAQIQSELGRARQARDEAAANKGVSAQNVAWFLVFWPGIVGNELNNSLVIQKADERAATLNRLYAAKGCATR